MMYTAFNQDCDSSSRCSSASPAADNLYYNSPAGSYSSMGSPQSQDFTELTVSSGSFVPTVTAISTSPDLQWMVQPVISSSVAPSHRAHPYSSSSSSAFSRAMRSTGARHTAGSKRSRAEQLSAEEEEKRRVRRERNKQAAAKCRNRRRELTDTLQAETDELEEVKSGLQSDIANLLKEKERLEFILAAHKPVCKIPADLEASSLSPSSHGLSLELSPVAAAPVPASVVSASLFSTVSSSSDVKMADLDSALEESLELLATEAAELETASRSVPDVDLSSSLYAAHDWEPLYTSVSAAASTSVSDFESLCTPVVTCTPSCTTYTSSFVFTYPETTVDALTCGSAHRRGSSSNDQSSDSLSSPTLLAL